MIDSDDIKIKGTHKKNTNALVPFSGVKPRLYKINAIGLDIATPKIQIKSKFLLSIYLTSIGVSLNATNEAKIYTNKNMVNCGPLSCQKSVLINKVKLLSKPQAIESVRLPNKKIIKDLFYKSI